MKKIIIIVILSVLINCISHAQTLYTSGAIGSSLNSGAGVGTNQPYGNFQIVGAPVFDASTRFHLTNGASEYGRANLVLTGRLQANNDAWAFGSGARSSLVFSSNTSNVVGAIGTEQFSIQHEQASNRLGFLSQTKGVTPILVMTQSGNIGMGTVSPEAKLHISNGAIMASDPNYSQINVRVDGTSIPAIRFTRWIGGGIHQHNAFIGQYYNNGEYSLGIGTGSATDGNQNTSTTHMTILLNGNVGIGASSPTSKLTVAGDINSREIKVTVNAGSGPDYVFEPTYTLPSLDSVQSYINQNKHLPEVPSAKEMEANGVNLGEMNMLLLKKVEELTLYVIEQQKTNVEQAKEIELLKTLIAIKK